jgi:hypothetical protein
LDQLIGQAVKVDNLQVVGTGFFTFPAQPFGQINVEAG